MPSASQLPTRDGRGCFQALIVNLVPGVKRLLAGSASAGAASAAASCQPSCTSAAGSGATPLTEAGCDGSGTGVAACCVLGSTGVPAVVSALRGRIARQSARVASNIPADAAHNVE